MGLPHPDSDDFVADDDDTGDEGETKLSLRATDSRKDGGARVTRKGTPTAVLPLQVSSIRT